MNTDQPGPAAGDPVSDDTPAQPATAHGPASADGAALDTIKRKKKKDKIRSAWISFAGRIVAQMLGAAASVVLGIYVVSSYGANRGKPTSTHVLREPRAAAATEPSLAVLPFDNFSGDGSLEHFVDAVTEALIADLAQTRGMRVISRTSSMHYKGQRKAVPEIAAELGVDLIIEGSIARSGNRMRVTAQLIDGPRDEHLWAGSSDYTVSDVLALQSAITSTIAGHVRAVVPGTSLARDNAARGSDGRQ
jgi:TolB-like protein